MGFSKSSHKVVSLILSPTTLNLRTKVVGLSLNYTFCGLFLFCFHNGSQTLVSVACLRTQTVAGSHKSLSFPKSHKSINPGNPPSKLLMTLSQGQVVFHRHIFVDAFSSSCYLRNCELFLTLNCIHFLLPKH